MKLENSAEMEEEKDLVAVEYPGRVQSVDNMIRSLGGLRNLSKVVIRLIVFFSN